MRCDLGDEARTRGARGVDDVGERACDDVQISLAYVQRHRHYVAVNRAELAQVVETANGSAHPHPRSNIPIDGICVAMRDYERIEAGNVVLRYLAYRL